jgi:hypothetical protein
MCILGNLRQWLVEARLSFECMVIENHYLQINNQNLFKIDIWLFLKFLKTYYLEGTKQNNKTGGYYDLDTERTRW